MPDLEKLIMDAVARGEFVHLSVNSDPKRGFAATFASASRGGGYAFGEGATPVQAMAAAIQAAPMVRMPSRIERAMTADDEALS